MGKEKKLGSIIKTIFIILGVLFLTVLVVFGGLFIIISYFSTSCTKVSYDTRIRSELSQIRSNAEQYYYRDGTYQGYDDVADSGWERIKGQIPDCSANILDDGDYLNDGINYQITVTPQEYAAWAPLCTETEETADFVSYCVDSEGTADNFEGSPVDLEGESCAQVFGE